MEIEDLIVDGVRVGDMDFSKFTRECHMRAWGQRLMTAYQAVPNSEFPDGTYTLTNYRSAKIKPVLDRLAKATELRTTGYIKARNMDLKVVRQCAHEQDEWPIGANDGRSPSEVVWEDFMSSSQMTQYEFSAYETLGDDECNAQGIDTLHDMFGSEFANRFYKRKNQLLATKRLKTLYDERDAILAQIAECEETAKG